MTAAVAIYINILYFYLCLETPLISVETTMQAISKAIHLIHR